ncbi:MAG: hypothetical protein WAX33_06655 [Rectinemataceae bacterium]
MARLPALLLLLLAVVAGATAQTVVPPVSPVLPAPPAAGAAALASMPELRRKTLPLDIAVSTWYELADMCLRYGLDAEGSAADLRSRLYAYFGLSAPGRAEGESVIAIEQASSLGYFTMESSAFESPASPIVDLSGGVRLTVTTPDGFSHRLEAERIRYDRENNAVEAEGAVQYDREGNGRSDRFTGSKIAVDLDDYSGVFLDGGFDLEPSAQTGVRTTSLRSASVLRRSDELVLFEDAVATACDDPEPHYSLHASKVWLLGSGDWAIQDAVLYLGRIPVLWLPFFYYPSDEIVFHPVFGIRSREGAFLQTTTYLIGARETASAKTGFLSVIQGGQAADGTVERSGIFLRKTGIPEAGSGAAGTAGAGVGGNAPGSMLRILADLYGALGVHVGVEGKFVLTPKGSIDFSAGLGVSRNLFLQSNGLYSPFDAASGYVSDWNEAALLGAELPFRFGLDFSLKNRWSQSGSYLDLSLSLPLWSDPWFEKDFRNRGDDSNWLGMLTGAGTASEAPAKRSAFAQKLALSGTWTPGISPVLSSFRLAKFESLASWRSKALPSNTLGAVQNYDPRREFFYPDSVKLFDAVLSASGNLLRLGGTTPASGAASTGGTTPTSGAAPAGLGFSLDWTGSGSAFAEDKFKSGGWLNPEDIDFALYYMLLSWKGGLGLQSRLYTPDARGELRASLAFDAQDQTRPLFEDERSAPATVHPYILADWRYRKTALSSSISAAFRPFGNDSLWSPSGLTWSISPEWLSDSYTGISTGIWPDVEPLYKTTYFGWNRDSVKVHSLALVIGARTGAATQKITLSAALPPLLELYSTRLNLDSNLVDLAVNGSIGQESENGAIKPLTLSAGVTVGKAPWPVLKSDFAWDFDAAAPLSSVSSLKYRSFAASFAMRKAKGYDFSGGQWVTDGTESFRPYEAAISFKPVLGGGSTGTTKPAAGAAGGAPGAAQGAAQAAGSGKAVSLAASANLSLVQNLVRYTDSAINLSLDFSVSIGKGFSLKFSGASSNRSAWRYWTAILPATASFDPGLYRKNFFTDLLDSVSIWDRSALERGSFKLKTLSIAMEQDLHDWDLAATLAMEPTLYDPGDSRPYYKMEFSFSLSVTWKDIPEMAARVAYADGAYAQ